MGWTVQGLNPSGSRFSIPIQTGPKAPQSPVQEYQVSFPGLKWPEHGADYPPPYSTKVEERVELYLNSPHWTFMSCYRENFTLLLLMYFPFQTHEHAILARDYTMNKYRCYVALETIHVGFLHSMMDIADCIRCVSGMKQDSSFRLKFLNPLVSKALWKVMLSHCKSEPVARLWCIRYFCWKIKHVVGETSL
jgi:hypothetical protein